MRNRVILQGVSLFLVAAASGWAQGSGNTSSGGSSLSALTEDKVVVEWNFDGDAPVLSGWDVNNSDAYVRWNADPSPASLGGSASYFSAPNSLNYNNATDYDSKMFAANGTITHVPNSGTAISPAFDIGKLSSPKLVFWCNFQTETSGTSYDQRRVQISNNNFSTTTMLRNLILGTTGASAQIGNCGTMGNWHQHSVVLDPAWGMIRIRLSFNTFDEVYNAYGGWAVDNIRITSVEAVKGSFENSGSEDGPSSNSGDSGGCGGSVADRGGIGSTIGCAILIALMGLTLARRRRFSH